MISLIPAIATDLEVQPIVWTPLDFLLVSLCFASVAAMLYFFIMAVEYVIEEEE